MSDASNDAMKRAQSIYQERPKVPPRSEEFVTVSTTSIEPLATDTNESKLIDSLARKHKVKRNSILLEDSIQDELGKLCARHDLIKATWIEAALVRLKKHPEIMKEVIAEAKFRGLVRKAATRYQQAKTITKKFGGNII